MARQKITPCLWFDGQAEEAAAFYVSIFPDSRVTNVTPGPGGKALVVEFQLAGLQFLALNGGPHYRFNEAISLSIDCRSQAEVDELWGKLSTGGDPKAQQCGWLKDKYGVSWQVVPAVLPQLLADPAKAGRVMPALMKMTKLDIQALQDAADGAH
jgi:predicted 3-demethylubiquinone-9 3-methyltransferase (glyoxalase superfamily)